MRRYNEDILRKVTHKKDEFKGRKKFNESNINSLPDIVFKYIFRARIEISEKIYTSNLMLKYEGKNESYRIKVLDKDFVYIKDKSKKSKNTFENLYKHINFQKEETKYKIQLYDFKTQEIFYDEEIDFLKISGTKPKNLKIGEAEMFFRIFLYDDYNEEIRKLKTKKSKKRIKK